MKSFAGFFLLAVLFLIFCAALGGLFVLTVDTAATIITSSSRQAEKKRLDDFLSQHGNLVLITGLQDEHKRVKHGKHYETEGRVWRLCEFPDGFVVEVEQRHSMTARVPQDGEKWRLKVVSDKWNSAIMFDDRVEKATTKSE